MFNKDKKYKEHTINQDIKSVVDSVESLLKSYAGDAKKEVHNVREKAHGLFKDARARIHSNNPISKAAKDAGSQVNKYINNNPWRSVSIGAATVFILGFLLLMLRN